MTVLRQIRRLLGATRRLAAGDLTARAGPPYQAGEVGELARAFDDTAVALETQAAEQERTLEALRASEVRFRSVFESANVGTSITLPTGAITVNQAFCDLLGYAPDELRHKTWQELTPPEEIEPTQQALAPLLSGARDATRFEKRYVHKHGGHVWANVSVAMQRDSTGQPLHFITTVVDITARKRDEALLDGQKAVLEQVAQGAPLRESLDLLLRVVEAQAPGMLGSILLLDEDGVHVRHGAAPRQPLSTVTLEAMATVADEIALGITRKQAEEQLQRQQETLIQTEKLAAMGELLAGVAHELNNPLSVVLGQAGLLRQQTSDPKLQVRADKMIQAAERCARIVKNFLALARQRPLERQRAQLNQVVREALDLLAYPLRVDNVTTVLQLDPTPPTLWADPHQLHQVVVNLVTNAHHALRQTAAPREITVTTRADPARGRVVLTVSDTGPGIPPAVRRRIFEPFFTTKPPGQGTGLGLSLCQGIVEQHRGTIDVESPTGRGAVFRIELPVEASPAEPEALAGAELPPIEGRTILVVDDEADVAAMLADLLGTDQHQVDVAHDGRAALERLRARAYDLVLSDVRMPELDGPGLYREAGRLDPDLQRRFVFLTGDTLSPEVREFLEATRVPSLTKPFTVADVRRAVREIVTALGDSRGRPR